MSSLERRGFLPETGEEEVAKLKLEYRRLSVLIPALENDLQNFPAAPMELTVPSDLPPAQQQALKDQQARLFSPEQIQLRLTKARARLEDLKGRLREEVPTEEFEQLSNTAEQPEALKKMLLPIKTISIDQDIISSEEGLKPGERLADNPDNERVEYTEKVESFTELLSSLNIAHVRINSNGGAKNARGYVCFALPERRQLVFVTNESGLTIIHYNVDNPAENYSRYVGKSTAVWKAQIGPEVNTVRYPGNLSTWQAEMRRKVLLAEGEQFRISHAALSKILKVSANKINSLIAQLTKQKGGEFVENLVQITPGTRGEKSGTTLQIKEYDPEIVPFLAELFSLPPEGFVSVRQVFDKFINGEQGSGEAKVRPYISLEFVLKAIERAGADAFLPYDQNTPLQGDYGYFNSTGPKGKTLYVSPRLAAYLKESVFPSSKRRK